MITSQRYSAGALAMLAALVWSNGAGAHWIPGYTVVDSGGVVTISVAAKLSADEVLNSHPTVGLSGKFSLLDVGVVVVSGTTGAFGDARQFRPSLVLTSAFARPVPVPDDPRILNLEFDFVGITPLAPGSSLGSFSFVPDGPGRAFTFVGQADDLTGSVTVNFGTVPADLPEPGTMALMAAALGGLALSRRQPRT